jgi:hypothetical protein
VEGKSSKPSTKATNKASWIHRTVRFKTSLGNWLSRELQLMIRATYQGSCTSCSDLLYNPVGQVRASTVFFLAFSFLFNKRCGESSAAIFKKL